MQLTVFWNIASCSLVEIEFIALMMTAAVPLKRRPVSTRLRGAKSQKIIIRIQNCSLKTSK
jgi:hypothetical protein